MKAFDTAIRKALRNVDDSIPDQRVRIYESARTALSNSQTKQGMWGTDVAATQTRRLETLISGIEAEYQQRAPKPAARPVPEKPAVRPEPTQKAVPEPIRARAQRSRQRAVEPRVQWSDEIPTVGGFTRDEKPAAQKAPRKPKKPLLGRKKQKKQSADDLLMSQSIGMSNQAPREKRRRPFFSIILVVSLALAFLGIGVMWAIFSGIMLSPEQRDTSVPNPPATINSEDFAGNPSADGAFSGDWIDVFSPDDISRVAGRGGAKAALIESGGRPALQVVSQSTGPDGEVLFELGAGILDTLAGRQSLVAMTLRSSTEVPTQIYVKCILPGGGECGRHRFDVTYEVNDVVFSLDLTKQETSGEPGFLALNSDVAGTNSGIDIYAIRVRPQ